MLAPSVVMPPCASNRAWKIRTMVPRTHMTGGPKRTAPSPVPVGCEHEPVTLGIFSADRTKVNAPAAARVRRVCGCSRITRRSFTAPCTRKGAAAVAQATQCLGGKNPSIMCIERLRRRQWRRRFPAVQKKHTLTARLTPAASAKISACRPRAPFDPIKYAATGKFPRLTPCKVTNSCGNSRCAC